jgi:hypothetical protein
MAARLSAVHAGRPPFTSRKILGTHFLRSSVYSRGIVRLEGLVQLKNPVTSSGIELATFRLVA